MGKRRSSTWKIEVEQKIEKEQPNCPQAVNRRKTVDWVTDNAIESRQQSLLRKTTKIKKKFLAILRKEKDSSEFL